MNTSPDEAHAANVEVQRELGLRVARDILGATGDPSLVEFGRLSANYFSFTFSVKASTLAGSPEVFVKIPKVDLRGTVPLILPITEGDRQMTRDEEASLRRLGRDWRVDDEEVHWVELLGTIPEFNALVTQRIFADDAVAILRRADLCRRLKLSREADRLLPFMARLGTAVGKFHASDTAPATFRLADVMTKWESHCRRLSERTKSCSPVFILRALQALGDLTIPGRLAPTLKGMDIRNVLIDEQDRLFLLDPGRMKSGFREADLARFLATYRMLHWGSVGLMLLGTPARTAERAFLEAYCRAAGPISRRLLNLYLIKEQLKHWNNILDYVAVCSWPRIFKKIVTVIYVDPFFRRLLTHELQNLTE